MPSMAQVLGRCREETPPWLRADAPSFDRQTFFDGRTVYYPGSGVDGQPVELCASAHAAHAYVYVDDSALQPYIAERLNDTANPLVRGYRLLADERVETALCGNQSRRTRAARGDSGAYRPAPATFAWFVVLQRRSGIGDARGPARLAVLFVGGDGFEAFQALYCRANVTPSPYLVVAQDHGFGGNRDSFGQGGSLEHRASSFRTQPMYLLVADNTNPWTGYVDLGADPQAGGEHAHKRRLYACGSHPR